MIGIVDCTFSRLPVAVPCPILLVHGTAVSLPSGRDRTEQKRHHFFGCYCSITCRNDHTKSCYVVSSIAVVSAWYYQHTSRYKRITQLSTKYISRLQSSVRVLMVEGIFQYQLPDENDRANAFFSWTPKVPTKLNLHLNSLCCVEYLMLQFHVANMKQ